jgi:hypothetical protein
MAEIREELRVRGVLALPTHDMGSILVIRSPIETDGHASGDFEHLFAAPEIHLSDDEIAAEDFKEIVLRKVTAVLGHIPRT